MSSNFHSIHLLLFQKLYTIDPYILFSMHKKITIWSTKHVWILKFDRIDNAQNRLWKLKLPSSIVDMTHIMGVGIEKSGVYHRYMYRLLTHSEKLFKGIPSLSLLEANRGNSNYNYKTCDFLMNAQLILELVISISICILFFTLLTFSAAWRVLTGAFCSSGGKYWVSVVCDDPEYSTPPSEQKHRDSGVTTKTSLASVLFPSKWTI